MVIRGSGPDLNTAATFKGTAEQRRVKSIEDLGGQLSGITNRQEATRRALAAGVPPDKVDDFVNAYIGKDQKPTTKPVVGVDPRTGMLRTYGEAPADAHFVTEPKPEGNPLGEANRLDRSYQFNSTQLDKLAKPIEDQASRLERLQTTINQQTPQADALLAPELLTVMAGGQGSGLRMNEAEIPRVVGGRSNFESLKAALNK